MLHPLDLTGCIPSAPSLHDNTSFFTLGYGLYVASTRENGKDNALIINTVSQIASNPDWVAVGINRSNYSHDVLLRTGRLNVSVLSQDAPFDLFQRFGFQSGRNCDKMKGISYGRSENNLPYLIQYSNAFLSLKVRGTVKLPSHTLFLCTVEESRVLTKEPTMTYAYYHAQVKPKKTTEKKIGWVCKICGHVLESEELPKDYVCPICKHPASDFEKVG